MNLPNPRSLPKVWGADALGFYSRAYNLLLFPTSELSIPLSSTIIPALSALQSFVVTDEMVLTVFGEQWRSSIEIFRMLGLSTHPRRQNAPKPGVLSRRIAQ